MLLALALALLPAAYAQDNTTALDNDPYLAFRPPFVHSLPVQILLTGVVLTLVLVLFIHLLFTAQYHWPLAPVNYVLQLSGVTTLLISLISTLHVVFASTVAESQRWPYMLSYVAVSVPGTPATLDGWSSRGKAAWLVMNAATSGLIQITHIQFLTLLYPSRLEGRLIFALLGPLAVVAAVMQLLPLQSSARVADLADAVRNVCNATLSLLFTLSLYLWGFLVNRRQAWRLDGGTAAFGAAALALALASTGLTFLYVPGSQEYAWLPGLVWAVVLWQSFLGWWWWVGAGSGSGLAAWDADAERELRRRERRAARRRERSARREEVRGRAGMVWRGVAGALGRAHADVSDASSTGTPAPPAAAGALPAVVRRWLASLRHAHHTAARRQAVERGARLRELARNGWGLGSFGRRARERARADGVEGYEQGYERGCERFCSPGQCFRRRDGGGEAQAHGEEIEMDKLGSVKIGRERQGVEKQTPMWWGPLPRWRLQDSTVY